MGEFRTTFIKNKATIHYLFLKHNFSYQQFAVIWVSLMCKNFPKPLVVKLMICIKS